VALTEAISDPQINFIRGLLRDRETDGLTETQRQWLESADFTTLTRGQARRVIDTLKELPARRSPTVAGANVPNGRYAVTEGDGVLRFYKVSSPTEGRWAGYTFVEVQASEEYHPIKDRNRKASILSLIAADVQEAMLRYGRELGHCGHCGRTLTNEYSREVGIGPVCRGKMGW